MLTDFRYLLVFYKHSIKRAQSAKFQNWTFLFFIQFHAVFISSNPNGHVRYWHHQASVVVFRQWRRRLLLSVACQSFSLKPLDQLECSLDSPIQSVWFLLLIRSTQKKQEAQMCQKECDPQALVSFKKYMPPPLPYFKVNICPFPLPHFASIFFAYLWSFRWHNNIVILPRFFCFRLPHLNIPTGPPSDELDKNSQRTWLSENLSHWNGYSHFRFALDFAYAFGIL